MSNPLRNPRLVSLLSIALLAAVFLITALPAALHDRKPTEKTGDFTHFYQAADAMRHGQNPYQSGVGAYIYPPLIAFLFQPLTLTDEHHAAVIWVILNAFITLAALLIAAKETAKCLPPPKFHNSEFKIHNSTLIIASLASLLVADKLRAIFSLGQTDCFMLLAFACTLRYMNRNPLLAGLAIGASAAVKYLTLIFLPYFLIKRNFKAAASTLVSFALFLLLPAVQLGFTKNNQYLATAFSGVGKLLGVSEAQTVFQPVHGWAIGWDRSVSITSALARLMQYFHLPDHLAAIPALILLLLISAAIILIARKNGIRLLQPMTSQTLHEPRTTSHEQRTTNLGGGEPQPSPFSLQPSIDALEWSTLVFIAIAFSPQTTNRHMVLMLLIYCAAVAFVFLPQPKKSRTLLIAALALMTAAQTLPPPNVGIDDAVLWWRLISGPSWCAAILLLAMTHTLANSATQLSDTQLSETRP